MNVSNELLFALTGVLRDPAFQTELGPLVLVNIKGVMESLNKNIADLDPKFLELILNGTLGALLKKQAAFAPGRPEADPTAAETGFNLGEDSGVVGGTVDSEMEVSAVEIAEWCNGLLGMMLILTNCTSVQIKKSFLEQFERLIMGSIESNINKVSKGKYAQVTLFFLVFILHACMLSPTPRKTISLLLLLFLDCDRGIPVLEEHYLNRGHVCGRQVAWAFVYATDDSVCGDYDCGQGRARGHQGWDASH